MVPPVRHPVWAEVILGKVEVPPSRVAINMLIANVRLSYKLDPTEHNLHTNAARMHDFFAQYENLYQAELKQILQSAAYA